MRGSTAMGSENRISRRMTATPATAVRLRRESATTPVTQLSSRPSQAQGLDWAVKRGRQAMIGAAGLRLSGLASDNT